MKKNQEYVDPKQMLALEEELVQLKQEHGISQKEAWWMHIGDWIANRSDNARRHVSRNTYIKLAVTCGWFSGAHRFYAGQKLLGTLYLLFCWTGIPFAMTLVDLMIALPMQPDQSGMIEL